MFVHMCVCVFMCVCLRQCARPSDLRNVYATPRAHTSVAGGMQQHPQQQQHGTGMMHVRVLTCDARRWSPHEVIKVRAHAHTHIAWNMFGCSVTARCAACALDVPYGGGNESTSSDCLHTKHVFRNTYLNNTRNSIWLYSGQVAAFRFVVARPVTSMYASTRLHTVHIVKMETRSPTESMDKNLLWCTLAFDPRFLAPRVNELRPNTFSMAAAVANSVWDTRDGRCNALGHRLWSAAASSVDAAAAAAAAAGAVAAPVVVVAPVAATSL